jgi:hypothetical protein
MPATSPCGQLRTRGGSRLSCPALVWPIGHPLQPDSHSSVGRSFFGRPSVREPGKLRSCLADSLCPKRQDAEDAQRARMGPVEGTAVTLPEVQLGSSPEAVTVIFIYGPAEQALQSLDGYLGVASLHPQRIEFDFTNMVLSWQ